MDKYIISNAVYVRGFPNIGEEQGPIRAIMATVDGVTMSVPLDPNNRHYAEILRQVEAGELTIQEADE
jgi:hypothetical protein